MSLFSLLINSSTNDTNPQTFPSSFYLRDHDLRFKRLENIDRKRDCIIEFNINKIGIVNFEVWDRQVVNQITDILLKNTIILSLFGYKIKNAFESSSTRKSSILLKTRVEILTPKCEKWEQFGYVGRTAREVETNFV